MEDVHIIKHKDTNKPRGCFVEFATRGDLEKALFKDGVVSLRQNHKSLQPWVSAGHSTDEYWCAARWLWADPSAWTLLKNGPIAHSAPAVWTPSALILS